MATKIQKRSENKHVFTFFHYLESPIFFYFICGGRFHLVLYVIWQVANKSIPVNSSSLSMLTT